MMQHGRGILLMLGWRCSHTMQIKFHLFKRTQASPASVKDYHNTIRTFKKHYLGIIYNYIKPKSKNLLHVQVSKTEASTVGHVTLVNNSSKIFLEWGIYAIYISQI